MLSSNSSESGLLDKLRTVHDKILFARFVAPLTEWFRADADLDGRGYIPKKLMKKKGLQWYQYRGGLEMIFLPEESDALQGTVMSEELKGKVVLVRIYEDKREQK